MITDIDQRLLGWNHFCTSAFEIICSRNPLIVFIFGHFNENMCKTIFKLHAGFFFIASGAQTAVDAVCCVCHLADWAVGAAQLSLWPAVCVVCQKMDEWNLPTFYSVLYFYRGKVNLGYQYVLSPSPRVAWPTACSFMRNQTTTLSIKQGVEWEIQDS